MLKHFEDGGFSVRLSACAWHGIAIDECHEMKINRDAKMAVVYPSTTKMDFISNYLPFRADIIRNLEAELFPECKKRSQYPLLNSEDIKTSENVAQMVKLIDDVGMFQEAGENEGLWNVFEKQEASSEQAHDLLKFR